MKNRINLHKKIRFNLKGTAARPRLAVFRSLNNIFTQLVDDNAGKTIASASSLKQKGSLTNKAVLTGKEIAQKAKELKVKSVVFDRGGFQYHGAVKTVADTVRQEGVEI